MTRRYSFRAVQTRAYLINETYSREKSWSIVLFVIAQKPMSTTREAKENKFAPQTPANLIFGNILIVMVTVIKL